VDWAEAAAFELLLFDTLTWFTRADKIQRWLTTEYPGLLKRLGFKMFWGS
jgi:hypothetical protein